MAIKSDWTHVFSRIFFFNGPVFSTASFEHIIETDFVEKISEIGQFFTIFGLSEVKSSFLAGACPKNPKIEFFLVLSVFSYVFERVKNLYGSIPRHRCILKEPSERVPATSDAF